MFPGRIFSVVMAVGVFCFISVAVQAAEVSSDIEPSSELQQQKNNKHKDKQIISNALEKPLTETNQTSFSLSRPMAQADTLLQIGLTGLFSFGGASVDNDAFSSLQAGGHDPGKNGFTVQNVELSIGATVDPYFDGQTNFIFLINADGETVVELEEVFFTTRTLPFGLQVKGGQYFTEFGRLNNQHPHTWAFADQPVVLSRFFGGDGLRSQGIRLAWLIPTDWYSEFYIGMQNAKGETATGFFYVPGENIGGHVLMDRNTRGLSDLLYSMRWLNGLDVSDTLSVNVGVSALRGPNATGEHTKSQIFGFDLYLKWQPITSQRGYPFVSWNTEVLKREYEAGNSNDSTKELLNDWGMYTELRWGFNPGWITGLRLEYANADGDTSSDPLRDMRWRVSPAITWYPSEYSKLRLQYNRDWAEHITDHSADSIWLQMEFSLGSHMAHTF